MKLLVLSDLHIDTGDKFGTFGWKAKKFIKTLDTILNHYGIEQVVLNGDVFDLYKYSYQDILARNGALIDYFREKGFVFIRGNHDLWNPKAKDHYTIANSRGQTIHIEHGHNADFLNGTTIGRFIGLLGFYILKFLVKFRWIERMYFRIVEYDDEVNRVPRKYNSYKYLLYALKLLRRYDLVILGHTHKLELHKMYYINQRKQYLNCGTCSLGRFQAVLIDTETLANETIKINRKAEFTVEELPPFPSKVVRS
ncbi:MAG: metallophosphoesterase family protein [Bacteroidales bacterium]|nr:metallophosphoesterase family protein [Bacteroidales bacterium]